MNEVQPRRRELLRVGRELFSVRAFDELSIDDIAAAAGVAKGLLYYYFRSKRGFYVAVIEDAIAELRERTVPDPALDPEEQMRASVEAHLAYVEENADGYRMLMDGGIGSDPEVKAIVDAEKERSVREIGFMLTGPTELPPHLRCALHGWLGFSEGATLDWLANRDISRDELRDLLFDAFTACRRAARATSATAAGHPVGG